MKNKLLSLLLVLCMVLGMLPISAMAVGTESSTDSFRVNHPAEGYGFRINGDKTVAKDADYTFTITWIDGFKASSDFAVKANGTELMPVNGVYTIKKVQAEQTITVDGVEVVSKVEPAVVNFTVTKGFNNFYVSEEIGEVLVDQTITVPYFDLSEYGVERYYYNPYCYVDEYGNYRGTQLAGTPETAYDKITYMHALIVATELFCYGYDADEVGKGASYDTDPGTFEGYLSWTNGVGSSFLSFWDHGSNINYYLNYVYPLGYPGWGATSDQILIKSGDVLSMHLITGTASGSSFGFFTVNDDNSKFDSGTDVVDTITVAQGEKVKLTHFRSAAGGNYSTSYKLQPDTQLYWISADDLTGDEADVTTWNTDGLGSNGNMTTDENGVVTIRTAGVEPGVYYLGTQGGFTDGGQTGSYNGEATSGFETGPSFFRLTVEEYEGKLGDANGDTEINAKDATVVLRYAANLETGNESTLDVNGDGQVNAKDATLILQFAAGTITSFPADSE